MCEFLEYDGGDYRMLPANGGPDDLATLWKREEGPIEAAAAGADAGTGARADSASRAS